MTQARIQAKGRARLAGQLKATINTTVTMIGIKAISAYIVHPPIFLAAMRGIMPAVARAMWGKCRGTGSSGVTLDRVACKLWGKVEREAGIMPETCVDPGARRHRSCARGENGRDASPRAGATNIGATNNY